MSLKYDNFRFYWTVITEKMFKYCLCNLSAGILNEESAFSPVLDIFNKVRQIPMNSY